MSIIGSMLLLSIYR